MTSRSVADLLIYFFAFPQWDSEKMHEVIIITPVIMKVNQDMKVSYTILTDINVVEYFVSLWKYYSWTIHKYKWDIHLIFFCIFSKFHNSEKNFPFSEYDHDAF